jgi:adhesin/invasin
MHAVPAEEFLASQSTASHLSRHSTRHYRASLASPRSSRLPGTRLSSSAYPLQFMSTPRRRLLAAIGASLALSIGCGDRPTEPAAAIPGTLAAASATTLNGTVGQPVAASPSVVVRSQHGDPMFGVRVTFAVTGGGTIADATAFTAVDGIATVGSWTLGPIAGEQTVTASVGSLPAVTFVANARAGPAATLEKSAGDEQTGPVATVLPIAPAVFVKDLLDNPVAGATVVFEVESGGGSLTGESAVTNNLGIAAVGSWTLGTIPGPNTLTATTGDHTVTFIATAFAGSPAEIAKEAGDNQSATVAQAVTIPPAVKITDALGNPVPGADVIFAVTSGGGSVTAGSQVTDEDGIATVGSWTLGTSAGTNTLTATAGSLTATFTATATVAAPANLDKQAGDAQTATVGTSVPTAPEVRLTDAHGNPIAGAAVVFAVASGGGSVAGANQTTDNDGVAAVGSWTLGTAAGSNTLTATAELLNATFTATGTAGIQSNMVKHAGDGQSATAGTAVAVDPAVRITDAHGNPVAGVSVTFAVALGGGSVGGANQNTNSDGIATVGSWTLGTTAGSNTLTATAASLNVTFTATGTAGPAANMAKHAGDNQSATVGTAVATNPAVRITDAHGNPVSGVSVTFAIASGDGSVTGETPTTDGDGIAAVGSWTLGTTAGSNTVGATAGSLVATFTATGTADAPDDIVIVAGDGQNAEAGTDVAIAPEVRVIDQFGNGVEGITVTFTVTLGDGSVTGAVQVTGSDGIATVGSWTLGPGDNELTATAGSLSTVFSATGTTP